MKRTKRIMSNLKFIKSNFIRGKEPEISSSFFLIEYNTHHKKPISPIEK